MNISVFDFSGIYDNESFYNNYGSSSFIRVDCRDITGTNCFCDDMAVAEIKKRIEEKNIPARGIHFIDSGNYHYMSKIMTDYIDEDFCLVYMDHHPDMQPPSFGDILSCGSWVMNAIDSNKYLKEIYAIGVDEGLISKIEPEYREKVHFLNTDNAIAEIYSGNLPVFLSVDKDVLSADSLLTNWDQGDMKMEELYGIVEKLRKEHTILGVDICGECNPDQEGIELPNGVKSSDEFNRKLLDIILGKC